MHNSRSNIFRYDKMCIQVFGKKEILRSEGTKDQFFWVQLYFLMNFMYSSNEILPLLSLSICPKFQSTISWVIGIFNGLKVSYINLLNSSLSMRSSSPPSLFWSFIEFLALSPKKWLNYEFKKWFYVFVESDFTIIVGINFSEMPIQLFLSNGIFVNSEVVSQESSQFSFFKSWALIFVISLEDGFEVFSNDSLEIGHLKEIWF